MERHLSAILAADMVGYSRLMETDETGTIERQKTHRRELINPVIEQFHGRIVKEMGDGILVEFLSVVDTVSCALVIQRAMPERETGVEDDLRIAYRIGINLGDVVVEGGDLFGDGVNVAARLEQLSEPGGVCISGTVYDHIQSRAEFDCSFLGEQQLKNISRPIRAYRVTASADFSAQLDEKVAPLPDAAPAPPDKPSIAVLPFDNMSGEPDQEYFSDGIVEDVITELSKYRWLLVIARNTTFTFRGAATGINEVAQELGVRYVMKGSIRKAGSQVRISAQLIDAQSGEHVWAERYDRALGDIFSLQDEITQAVAGAIQPSLFSAEADRARRKTPESMAAWDYAVRGRWHVLRMTREDNAEAVRLLRAGLENYPKYVPLLAFLSFGLTTGVILGWSDDPGNWLTEARQLAQRAATLDENDVWVQCALGLGHFTAKRPAEAIGHYSKAIELNPSFALAHGYLALQLAFAGKSDEAIREAETAIRLSPRDPELFHFFVAIATAHFVAQRYEDAVLWAEKSIQERPNVPGPLRLLATSLAHLDRVDEARETFMRILQISPHISATGIRRAIHFGGTSDLERYIDGMRKVGLPET